jgi:6-phosphogluconolactonase
VSFDQTKRFAFVSNFGRGAARSAAAQSVAMLPIDPALRPATATARHNGSGPRLPHQDGPHTHCAVVSPDNRFVIVADFGTDEVLAYPLDADSGKLGLATACRLPPGSAPRTLAFAPDGRTLFASAELASSLATLDWDAMSGRLTLRAMTSTLPAGTTVANYPAEIRLSPNGRFLYLGNRGHESIAVFSIGEGDPRLVGAYPVGGSWPRCLCLTEDGDALIVANQRTGELVLLATDPGSGALAPGKVIAHAAEPVFVGLATFGQQKPV